MITVKKIIYYHDKNCSSAKVKKRIGEILYTSEDVSIPFDSIEELNIHREALKKSTGYKIIDFVYIDDLIENKEPEYITENREICKN